MSISVTIHGVGSGLCSLTGKEESDGLTVTFQDGTAREQFLSWKAFRQLLTLKTGQKAPPRTESVPQRQVQPVAAPAAQPQTGLWR
jgi:hypothetical protein